MKKLIGIFTQRREYAGRIFNNLAFDYVRAVEKSGALAVLIPIFSENVSEYMEMCDGFIFPGGPDIDPELYGHGKHGARGIIPAYDRFLLSHMHTIFESGKPILGICKGMQLLNIAHGGTLKQDIEESSFHFQGERGYEKVDTIEILYADSWLASIYPERCLGVNSIHHQAVDELGEGLRIVARSQYDQEVESIEHTRLPHYGVQWHPEYFSDHGAIFEYFTYKC